MPRWPEPEPEPEPPASLVNIDKKATLTVSSVEGIPESLSSFLEQDLEKGFTRILVKNKQQNQFTDLPGFLSSFGVQPPSDFYMNLKASSTFFNYVKEGNDRLGFISKIKQDQEEEISQVLSDWESDLEEDFRNFYELMDYGGDPLSSSFNQGTHNNQTFKCQAFNREDLGVCYTVTEDYFLFTSSWKGMEELIDLTKLWTMLT